jgi:hypothetical protein
VGTSGNREKMINTKIMNPTIKRFFPVLILVIVVIILLARVNWPASQNGVIQPEDIADIFEENGFHVYNKKDIDKSNPGPMDLNENGISFNLNYEGIEYKLYVAILDRWQDAEKVGKSMTYLNKKMNNTFCYAFRYKSTVICMYPSNIDFGKLLNRTISAETQK